jgi:ribosomal 50S subunit-associated protein YjgA (DUF615 family)
MECLECKKEITQTKGKRPKKFCNSTCRSNYWQKEQRKNLVNDLYELGMSVTKIDAKGVERINPLSKEGQQVLEQSKNVSRETSGKWVVKERPTPPAGLTPLQKKVWLSDYYKNKNSQ